jgi:hypothetical protein
MNSVVATRPNMKGRLEAVIHTQNPSRILPEGKTTDISPFSEPFKICHESAALSIPSSKPNKCPMIPDTERFDRQISFFLSPNNLLAFLIDGHAITLSSRAHFRSDVFPDESRPPQLLTAASASSEPDLSHNRRGTSRFSAIAPNPE